MNDNDNNDGENTWQNWRENSQKRLREVLVRAAKGEFDPDSDEDVTLIRNEFVKAGAGDLGLCDHFLVMTVRLQSSLASTFEHVMAAGSYGCGIDYDDAATEMVEEHLRAILRQAGHFAP